MQVRDVMNAAPWTATPEQPLQAVAQIMAREDIGFMPVGENDRLVGVVTDRDMAVGFSEDMDGTYLVRDVMTREVKYCFEDEDTREVMDNMAALKVRRMPVVNRDKRLVGVLSFGDLARKDDAEKAGAALREVMTPGGAHTQERDFTADT